MRRIIGTLVLCWAIQSAWADTAPSCPTYDVANARLRARATYLQKQLGLPRALADTPDLAVALTNVVAARAKEEARVWLIQQLSDELCTTNKPGQPYFPNTCKAVKVSGEYPGASLTVLRTQFKRDVYALPACYLYPKESSATAEQPEPKDDAAIDPYVIEAALVGLYLQSKSGAQLDEDSPNLDPLPTAERLAEVLVAATTAQLGLLPGTAAPAAVRASSFKKPSLQDIQALVGDVADLYENNAKPTPEAAWQKVRPAITKWCKDAGEKWCKNAGEKLDTVANTYFSAIRGNFTEAALTAANDFLCTAETPPHFCSRLPVIGEVASAKTQADMESALDHAIEPVGAWKRKQAERVWSLNAMAGAAVGREQLKVSGASASHTTSGLYLPVALEGSIPLHWGIFRSGAIGLTMLDLGGLVSYSQQSQLGGGQSSSASNTHWSSITSPGFYVALAFKNSPFRIGVSASRTPKLRSVDFGDGVQKDADSTRVLLFVTADVPLLAF